MRFQIHSPEDDNSTASVSNSHDVIEGASEWLEGIFSNGDTNDTSQKFAIQRSRFLVKVVGLFNAKKDHAFQSSTSSYSDIEDGYMKGVIPEGKAPTQLIVSTDYANLNGLL